MSVPVVMTILVFDDVRDCVFFGVSPDLDGGVAGAL